MTNLNQSINSKQQIMAKNENEQYSKTSDNLLLKLPNDILDIILNQLVNEDVSALKVMADATKNLANNYRINRRIYAHLLRHLVMLMTEIDIVCNMEYVSLNDIRLSYKKTLFSHYNNMTDYIILNFQKKKYINQLIVHMMDNDKILMKAYYAQYQSVFPPIVPDIAKIIYKNQSRSQLEYILTFITMKYIECDNVDTIVLMIKNGIMPRINFFTDDVGYLTDNYEDRRIASELLHPFAIQLLKDKNNTLFNMVLTYFHGHIKSILMSLADIQLKLSGRYTFSIAYFNLDEVIECRATLLLALQEQHNYVATNEDKRFLEGYLLKKIALLSSQAEIVNFRDKILNYYILNQHRHPLLDQMRYMLFKTASEPTIKILLYKALQKRSEEIAEDIIFGLDKKMKVELDKRLQIPKKFK